MKRNFTKEFRQVAKRLPKAEELELAKLVDLASALETEEIDTDSMFRFNIRAPYSEAPVASSNSWSSEETDGSN